MVESLLISNYLQSYVLASLMVVAFKSLAEASLSQRLDYLIAICDVIAHHHIVVTSIVIEAIVLFE